jgi:hypothetical protein
VSDSGGGGYLLGGQRGACQIPRLRPSRSITARRPRHRRPRHGDSGTHGQVGGRRPLHRGGHRLVPPRGRPPCRSRRGPGQWPWTRSPPPPMPSATTRPCWGLSPARGAGRARLQRAVGVRLQAQPYWEVSCSAFEPCPRRQAPRFRSPMSTGLPTRTGRKPPGSTPGSPTGSTPW